KKKKNKLNNKALNKYFAQPRESRRGHPINNAMTMSGYVSIHGKNNVLCIVLNKVLLSRSVNDNFYHCNKQQQMKKEKNDKKKKKKEQTSMASVAKQLQASIKQEGFS
ncbi:hypothetical protein RFI_39210, partial [Reticulomyxa filosa]